MGHFILMLLLLTILEYRNMERDNAPHEEFIVAARCIAHCIDVFCKVKKLINVGLALQQRDTVENGDITEDEDLRASRDKRLSKM
jgi:hypothetical protein